MKIYQDFFAPQQPYSSHRPESGLNHQSLDQLGKSLHCPGTSPSFRCFVQSSSKVHHQPVTHAENTVTSTQVHSQHLTWRNGASLELYKIKSRVERFSKYPDFLWHSSYFNFYHNVAGGVLILFNRRKKVN